MASKFETVVTILNILFFDYFEQGIVKCRVYYSTYVCSFENILMFSNPTTVIPVNIEDTPHCLPPPFLHYSLSF